MNRRATAWKSFDMKIKVKDAELLSNGMGDTLYSAQNDHCALIPLAFMIRALIGINDDKLHFFPRIQGCKLSAKKA